MSLHTAEYYTSILSWSKLCGKFMTDINLDMKNIIWNSNFMHNHYHKTLCNISFIKSKLLGHKSTKVSICTRVWYLDIYPSAAHVNNQMRICSTCHVWLVTIPENWWHVTWWSDYSLCCEKFAFHSTDLQH